MIAGGILAKVPLAVGSPSHPQLKSPLLWRALFPIMGWHIWLGLPAWSVSISISLPSLSPSTPSSLWGKDCKCHRCFFMVTPTTLNSLRLLLWTCWFLSRVSDCLRSSRYPWSSKWNPGFRSPWYLSCMLTGPWVTELTPVPLWMQTVIISSLAPNLNHNSFACSLNCNHGFPIHSVYVWKFPYSFLHDLKGSLNMSTIEILGSYLKPYHWPCCSVKLCCQLALWTTE